MHYRAVTHPVTEEEERGGRDGLKVSKRAWKEFRNVLKELNIDDSVDKNVFQCTLIFFSFI